MPIVIEEMTVQIEVNAPGENTAAAQPRATAGDERNPQAVLIKACVEEVMEVMRHQNER